MNELFAMGGEWVLANAGRTVGFPLPIRAPPSKTRRIPSCTALAALMNRPHARRFEGSVMGRGSCMRAGGWVWGDEVAFIACIWVGAVGAEEGAKVGRGERECMRMCMRSRRGGGRSGR